jgi:hypothetical protein
MVGTTTTLLGEWSPMADDWKVNAWDGGSECQDFRLLHASSYLTWIRYSYIRIFRKIRNFWNFFKGYLKRKENILK